MVHDTTTIREEMRKEEKRKHEEMRKEEMRKEERRKHEEKMRKMEPVAEVDDAAKKGDIARIKQLQQRDASGKPSCHQHYIIISIIKCHQQLQSCLSRHTIAFGVEEHIWRR